jgi:peptidoglycan/LPS O-acetylase OafA/YrhL
MGVKTHVYSIDALRGYASLIVCLFHLSDSGKAFESTILRAFANHGGIGVQIFFLISGFVIPYALYTQRYRPSNLPQFLAKRLMRLHPPYIVSMLVAIVLWVRFGYSAGGHPLEVDYKNLALHLGYLVDLADASGVQVNWYIPVYWTLAYEVQFYLVVGLTIPLLTSHRLRNRLIGWAAFLGPQLLLGQSHGVVPVFFQQAYLFVFGILLFQVRVGLIRGSEFIVLGSLTLLTAGLKNPMLIYVPLIVILVLRFDVNTRITAFLGSISYSLYLFHDSFGQWLRGALITVARMDEVSAVLLAILGSIAFATVMHVLVEKPAIRWAKSLRRPRVLHGAGA